jgi:hypothetical protein
MEVNGWAATVWIDPGGTSGWGVMCIDPEDLVGQRPIHKLLDHWMCGEISATQEDAQASEILELYDMWEDAAIGIESFTVRKFLQNKEFLAPVRIRAKVEYGLWLAEKWQADEDERLVGRPRTLFTQDPSMAKRTLTDDRQHEYKLWEPGRDHKRDAIKHCYTFLQRCRDKPRLRYFAWPNLFKSDGEPLKRRPHTTKRSMY